jgi:hypothetical protein
LRNLNYGKICITNLDLKLPTITCFHLKRNCQNFATSDRIRNSRRSFRIKNYTKICITNLDLKPNDRPISALRLFGMPSSVLTPVARKSPFENPFEEDGI